jgi:hypothetical protein
MSREMYDGMFQQVGGKLRVAPGFIAHLAGPTAGGWSITEVWESQEALETFVRDTIAPMMAGAGLPIPEPQIRPIHNLVVERNG